MIHPEKQKDCIRQLLTCHKLYILKTRVAPKYNLEVHHKKNDAGGEQLFPKLIRKDMLEI